MESKMESGKNKICCCYFISVVLLLAYPLRHIYLGVDLWDAGYNYANFKYSGPEYMDAMWYYATWLATAFGKILTRLPGGGSMLGMNVYTSLIIGMMGAGAFWFCVKRLHMPVWLAFWGEILALSLCWAPSGLLYHYLTYGLFMAGTLCLYHGLTAVQEKRSQAHKLLDGQEKNLLLAGMMLGLNVAVRFSNLPQAGMILAVWYYGFISRKKLSKVLRETGSCILGYGLSVGLFLAWMAFRHGLDEYAAGVLRLFAMTENAPDYTPGAMLFGMLRAYTDDAGTYWLKRFVPAAAVALLCCGVLPEKLPKVKKLVTALITLALTVWFFRKGYCNLDYASYNSVYYPCLLIFLLAFLLAGVWMADRRAGKERKLLAFLALLTIYLSSLGSNNALYSSINNLFLVLPVFLWMAYVFFREKTHILYFPLKAFLAAGILLLTVQGIGFGQRFVYEEAAGARDVGAEIENIPVLRGMHTDAQKAERLTELYEYLHGDESLYKNEQFSGNEDSNENNEQGIGGECSNENKENGIRCILYGNIPGLAYYMELVPAMNIWGGLRSYDPQAMLDKLGEIEQETARGGEKPVVILEEGCRNYLETGSREGLLDPDDESFVLKLEYIGEYMQKQGYFLDYFDGSYAVYR